MLIGFVLSDSYSDDLNHIVGLTMKMCASNRVTDDRDVLALHSFTQMIQLVLFKF